MVAALCLFLIYLELGLFLFGGGISTLVSGQFTLVVVVTAGSMIRLDQVICYPVCCHLSSGSLVNN